MSLLGYSIFVPNGLEQVNQDSGNCAEVGLQHFSMIGVYSWGFPLFIALMAFLKAASD